MSKKNKKCSEWPIVDNNIALMFWGRICAMVMILLVSCELPYTPEPEPAVFVSGGDSEKTSVRVYPINGTMQICNASISQDTVNFPAAMLWLNFNGSLPVKVADTLDNFGDWDDAERKHDRLTITDATNTVRWFMKLGELGAGTTEEFQDPEWSTHPEYIVSLLSQENWTEWGCYVIHPVTRSSIKIIDKGLNETSTPHVWVAQSAHFGEVPEEISYDDDGCADIVAVRKFFGTDSVRIVVALKVGGVQTLYIKNYTDDKGLVPLKRPLDSDGWDCESPLISPDGNWVVYNAFKTQRAFSTYLQKFNRDAGAVLVEEGGADPHWWVNPSDPSFSYIIYEKVPGSTLIDGDLADEGYLQSGELGSTWFQTFRLFASGSTRMNSIIRTGNEMPLVNLPTKGGLSPDGRYLCTGSNRAFMIELSE